MDNVCIYREYLPIEIRGTNQNSSLTTTMMMLKGENKNNGIKIIIVLFDFWCTGTTYIV